MVSVMHRGASRLKSLKESGKNSRHLTVFLFRTGLIVWFLGIGSRDFYLIFMGLFAFAALITRQNIFEFALSDIRKLFSGARLYWLLGVSSGIIGLTFLLRYYSFSWNLYDVGIFSDILLQLTKGSYYSSTLETHALADHFTPSITLLALFYWVYPHVHWLVMAKWAAYITVPFLAQKVACRLSGSKSAGNIGLLCGAFWLLLYAPAVNGIYYGFQPSCLSLPFILLAFLFYLDRKFLPFILCMIFLLGFKEHLGAVWIGFGCFFFLNPRDPFDKWLGIALVVAGIIAVYLIIFEIMPYFREYKPAWSQPIGPFENIPAKIWYGLAIMVPLFGLPVFFWRQGIIAMPAIGINLISGSNNMISRIYHYDDIASVLLLIAVLAIIAKHRDRLQLFKTLPGKILAVTAALVVIAQMPVSPVRQLVAAIPNKEDLAKLAEIQRLDADLPKDQLVFVHGRLIHYLYLQHVRQLRSSDADPCSIAEYPSGSVVVVDNKIDFKSPPVECIEAFDRQANWEKLPYQYIHVYRVL